MTSYQSASSIHRDACPRHRHPLGRATAVLMLVAAGWLYSSAGLVLTARAGDGADPAVAVPEDSLLDHVPDHVFGAKTFTLANGLQVIAVPNHRAPVVTHMVWYKVGAADDPRGKYGLAHFLEHLMFKGTKTVGPGEFSRIIASLGGRENAFTSYEYTAFYQTVAREHLERMMQLEADRMANLTLDPALVDAERKVIAEERRQTVESSPGRRLGEAMDAELYAGSPYAVPVLGWSENIQGLGQTDVEQYYHRWYAPNNAVLVVSGDITADELRPLAEKYYGPLKPNPDLPVRLRPAPQPMLSSSRIVLHDPQIEKPSFSRSVPAPADTLGTEPEAYALAILMDIMGSGDASRLSQALVIDQRIANSVGIHDTGSLVSAGAVTIWGEPSEGHGVDALEVAVDQEISLLLQHGVSDDEVRRSKERLLAGAIFARDSINVPARLFGSSWAMNQTLDDVESWPARIAAVDTALVNRVAHEVFEGKRAVTGVLLPPIPASDGGSRSTTN